MSFKYLIKKDYVLLLLLSILYFLTIKNVVPVMFYFFTAIIMGIYFFPVKPILLDTQDQVTKKRSTITVFYFFIVSNSVALTSLELFQKDKSYISTAIAVYSILNVGFLIYFYLNENVSYNFILSCSLMVLMAATSAL